MAYLVTRGALIKRINRKLAESGDKLVKARGARVVMDLGDYYTLDLRRNCVIDKDIDLGSYGRELGVLGAHEKLSE